MSGHHRRSLPRTVLNRRVAGAGVAGVAAVFTAAPFAHAAPVNADSGSTATAPQTKAPATAAGTKTVRAAAVEPNFGFRKIRVGVQIKSGAFVPTGTNTGGTKISIVETGPGAGTAALQGTSCTTVVGSEQPGSTETVCDFSQQVPVARTKLAGADVHQLDGVSNTDYLLFPGDSVTFTQTTVNPNLVIDPTPQTFGPCVNPQVGAPVKGAAPVDFPLCTDAPHDATFNDAGLPPQAKNDSLKVSLDKSGIINVLGNDVTKGAPATITILTQPAHGTATVVGANASAIRALKAPVQPTIKYTPKTGFFGHDSFTYRLTTANGTSTARVSVLVTAPPTARDDSASTTSGAAVTVDALANDAANGGTLAIASVADPAHGTATIHDGKIVYTPDTDFVGTDTFTYVASTAGGTDTATVTVTVSGSGVANTGGPDDQLIGLAALLLVTGGAASVAGRRRYRARHVGRA